MLPVEKRLNSAEIVQVLKQGKTKIGPFFVLKFLPSPEGNRFAIIVGKSHGKPVERSKLKRRLRAILSDLDNLKPGWRVVLLVRSNSQPKATELSFAQLQSEVHQLLLKAGILPKQ